MRCDRADPHVAHLITDAKGRVDTKRGVHAMRARRKVGHAMGCICLCRCIGRAVSSVVQL